MKLHCHYTHARYTLPKEEGSRAHIKLQKRGCWRWQNLSNTSKHVSPGNTSKTPGTQSLKPKQVLELQAKRKISETTEQDGDKKQCASQSERQAGRANRWSREMTTENVASEEIAGKQCGQQGTIRMNTSVPSFWQIHWPPRALLIFTWYIFCINI